MTGSCFENINVAIYESILRIDFVDRFLNLRIHFTDLFLRIYFTIRFYESILRFDFTSRFLKSLRSLILVKGTPIKWMNFHIRINLNWLKLSFALKTAEKSGVYFNQPSQISPSTLIQFHLIKHSNKQLLLAQLLGSTFFTCTPLMVWMSILFDSGRSWCNS